MKDLRKARTLRGRTKITEAVMIDKYRTYKSIISICSAAIRVVTELPQTAPSACRRSLEFVLRSIGFPKCDNNCHRCSFGCSLRRIITNGK